MKRLILFSILIAVLLVTPSVYAQRSFPLGFGNLALKVDYFRFTDSDLEDLDLENGVYIGIEGYMALLDTNFYLGMETGWAGTSSDTTGYYDGWRYKTDVDVDYVPIEFNVKSVFPIDPIMNFGVGAGLSANYFNINVDGYRYSDSEDDWLFGGQLFADLNFRMDPWFAGVNVKYQWTDDIELGGIDTDVSASNFRAGGQVGIMF